MLSFLLVLAPVTSAFSAQMGHDSMDQGSTMRHFEMSDVSACTHVAQDQSKKSCCEDSQCDKHCQAMQCHTAGKLSAISVDGSIEPGFNILRQIHARLFHLPANGISNTPLRPPIVHL
ncbi:MAG: hypothetical protein U9N50_11890 [Pseudomonadota bacterium]|nr:hypothetical protein [Pseudomonadota bacterium]